MSIRVWISLSLESANLSIPKRKNKQFQSTQKKHLAKDPPLSNDPLWATSVLINADMHVILQHLGNRSTESDA